LNSIVAQTRSAESATGQYLVMERGEIIQRDAGASLLSGGESKVR